MKPRQTNAKLKTKMSLKSRERFYDEIPMRLVRGPSQRAEPPNRRSNDDDARLHELSNGQLRWFRDWPDASVPRFGAGVYTIWNTGGQFVYVGMSGRSINAETAIPNRAESVEWVFL